jgi:glyoxylase-like metal-dependent hydrolase (beta-lactamase superfamily II)
MLKRTDYTGVSEFKVARTIMGRPIYYNHFFYCDGLLIDSGPSRVAGEVLSALKILPVKKVIITHQHEDHTGNCRLIGRELGIPIYAHPGTVRVMASPPSIQVYRKLMWGKMPPAEARPLKEVVTTGRYQFQVIHTPGHSSDHVSFFEPTMRWLFCGDLYLGESLNSFMAGENIADHLTSLKKTISLKPKILFCGLKGKLENAEDRLRRKYECWWDICSKVLKLKEEGLERKEILKKVLGGETLFYFFSQSNWGRRFMLDSIIDNSDYFRAEKKSLTGIGNNRQETEQTNKPSSVLP